MTYRGCHIEYEGIGPASAAWVWYHESYEPPSGMDDGEPVDCRAGHEASEQACREAIDEAYEDGVLP